MLRPAKAVPSGLRHRQLQQQIETTVPKLANLKAIIVYRIVYRIVYSWSKRLIFDNTQEAYTETEVLSNWCLSLERYFEEGQQSC